MKWWFGRKAGREGVRPFLFRWGQGSSHAGVGEWPRSYEAQVREAYLGNPVAQRAVRLVAESAASAVVYAALGGDASQADAVASAGPPPPRFARSPSPFRGGLVRPRCATNSVRGERRQVERGDPHGRGLPWSSGGARRRVGGRG